MAVNKGIGSAIHAALRSDEPLDNLRRAVDGQLSAGVSREAINARLEVVRSELRAEGREDDEDVVLDVMDFVTGWSSPHMRL